MFWAEHLLVILQKERESKLRLKSYFGKLKNTSEMFEKNIFFGRRICRLTIWDWKNKTLTWLIFLGVAKNGIKIYLQICEKSQQLVKHVKNTNY